MNNITLDDIDQNRPIERPSCARCGKVFGLFESRVVLWVCGWSKSEAHIECAQVDALRPRSEEKASMISLVRV
jgi:hypothetical protein